MRMEAEAITSGQTSNGVTKCKTVFGANKTETLKFLNALGSRTYNKNGIIPFPEISRVLSWWRIRKEERDDILYNLQQEGYLKVVPFRGVILEEGQR